MTELLQHFHWDALLKIIGIDLMLGVDNAIVIALACAALPEHLRGRAMMLGTAAAVGLRAILLFCANYVLAVPFIKLIAGAYLFYIGYKLLIGQNEEHHISPADKMWTAIRTIVVADFMMSLDNVLGVASAAHTTGELSNIYATLGIVLSIPVIVYGAKYLSHFMEKYPIIMWAGAGLLGWVGMEMLISDNSLHAYLEYSTTLLGTHSHLVHKILGFSVVIGMGLLYKHQQKSLTTNAP